MEKVADGKFATYRNHRREPYFTFVKNGQKTIEGRIKKGYYQFIKPGDRIVIYNEEETDHVTVVVKGVRNYSSIKEMLENEPLREILPEVKNIAEGIKVYQRFYTKEQEQEFGLVAIEVVLLP